MPLLCHDTFSSPSCHTHKHTNTQTHKHTHAQQAVTDWDCDCPPGAHKVRLPIRFSLPFLSPSFLNLLQFQTFPIIFPTSQITRNCFYFSLDLSSSSATITSSHLHPLAELQSHFDANTMYQQLRLSPWKHCLCDGTYRQAQKKDFTLSSVLLLFFIVSL